MNNSFVIDSGFLSRLCDMAERYDNIILGTGKTARDLQGKLRIMHLKSSFLVGDRDEPQAGVIHYARLPELEDRDHLRFILAVDREEHALIAPMQAQVYNLLGIASYGHPRMLRLTSDAIVIEHAGGVLNDAHIQDTYLKDDLPYVRFGEAGKKAFSIHIFGGSTSSSMYSYAAHCWPEFLWRELRAKDFDAVVYSWGKPSESASDCLVEFLRDGIWHKPDLVLLYKGADICDVSRINAGKTNLLTVKNVHGSKRFTRLATSMSAEKKLGGLDFDVSDVELYDTLCRVFKALSHMFGFAFWSIVGPSGVLLPQAQARQLLGLGTGYLARKRAMKQAYLQRAKDYCVKDYTDIFAGEDNIFDMYADITHLTNEGNRRVARGVAKDILEASNLQRRGVPYGENTAHPDGDQAFF